MQIEHLSFLSTVLSIKAQKLCTLLSLTESCFGTNTIMSLSCFGTDSIMSLRGGRRHYQEIASALDFKYAATSRSGHSSLV